MKYLFFLFIITWLLGSCQKVIDVHLKGAEKKYVIEGIISDQAGQCRVTITQTGDFDDDNNFPTVSGATVSIIEINTGTTTQLTESTPGVYSAAPLTGIYGNTYQLHVNIDGEIFTASSTLPQPVALDTIYVTQENWFDGTEKVVNIEFNDPRDFVNQYRFTRTVNGFKTKKIFINNDDLTNGRHTNIQLFVGSDGDIDDEDIIDPGDTVQIEMQCIDRNIYKYWYSMEQGTTGEVQNGSPTNPVSNMVGGALGYFSAHTSQLKTVVVQ